MDPALNVEQHEAAAIPPSALRTHKRKLLAGLGLLVVGGALVSVYFAGRPWYRGRSVSFWFDGLNQRYRALGQGQQSAWGSSNTWVNLENQQLLKEFDPFRRMGAEAVPFLLNVLEHPVPERDSRALFRKWLPQRLKFLAPWPKPESEQQLMALWILGEIGPAARNISANVLHYIEVPGLDYVAADALRKIGVDADIAMPMLCRSLVKQSTLDTEGVDKRRGIGHGRAPILLLLYSLGTNAQAAAPILIEEQERCLDRIRAIDKHSSTRDWDAGWLAVEKANLLYTAEALCRVSPQESQKAAPFLAKVLRDKEFFTEHTRLGLPEMKSSPNRKMVSPDARARAAQCLSEIGSLEAVLVLKDFLKDDDADVVAAAREAVQRGLSR